MKEAYTSALAYLEKGSPTAKAIITALHSDKAHIDVAICTAGSEPRATKYFTSKFVFEGDGTPTVHWNPGYQLDITAGQKGFQSPALGLLHELGHAKQWLDGKAAYEKRHNAAIGGSKADMEAIEEDNTKRHETVVAKELGEPWRTQYKNYGGTIGFNAKDEKLTWDKKVALFKLKK